MFNPIFNADGSISYFRVTCLVVAIGCLVSGCVMKNDETPDIDEVAAVQDESADDTSSVEVEKTSVIDTDKLRVRALQELYTDIVYMQSCGDLDSSFDNCQLTLAHELTPYYELKLESSADGYLLKLSATADNEDSCKVFENDSNGNLVAFDAEGNKDLSCTAPLTSKLNTFAIVRDTDNHYGDTAPSGISPITRH